MCDCAGVSSVVYDEAGPCVNLKLWLTAAVLQGISRWDHIAEHETYAAAGSLLYSSKLLCIRVVQIALKLLYFGIKDQFVVVT